VKLPDIRQPVGITTLKNRSLSPVAQMWYSRDARSRFLARYLDRQAAALAVAKASRPAP
jgi:hypothetical protein